MGRIGYMGCLTLLGVVMLSVSCLAVFGATGAITAVPGDRVAPIAVSAGGGPTDQVAATPTSSEPRRTIGQLDGSAPAEATKPAAVPAAAAKPATGTAGQPATKAEPTTPALSTPAAARTGPESNIAQRLDREAIGGGLKLRALGAAKTTQGERSVLAIYVRIENDGAAVLRIDPTNFKLLDRAGNRYTVTRAVEQMFPPVELKPRAAPGQQGELTEGNLTFEIPRTAAGLALTYDLPSGGQPLRIPLPPEFG
jgi:hypothetical protein